jgi:hypothetical protein
MEFGVGLSENWGQEITLKNLPRKVFFVEWGTIALISHQNFDLNGLH